MTSWGLEGLSYFVGGDINQREAGGLSLQLVGVEIGNPPFSGVGM